MVDYRGVVCVYSVESYRVESVFQTFAVKNMSFDKPDEDRTGTSIRVPATHYLQEAILVPPPQRKHTSLLQPDTDQNEN
jgi:hypothetical protein